MSETAFIKLATRTINTNMLTVPFGLTSVIEISMQIDPNQFDIFYEAFEKRTVLVLTVIDIQCVFEGLIFSIKKETQDVPPGLVGCTLQLSSIYRVLFDNSITEEFVIKQLEFEKFRTGQKGISSSESAL